MHGIFLAIQANSLSDTNGSKALSGWNNLQPLLSTCNFYIKEAVQDDERDEFIPLTDLAQAKKVVGYMIYTAMKIPTAVKEKSKYFSLAALDDFRIRASSEAPAIAIDRVWEPHVVPETPHAEIVFDIGGETAIERAVREMAEKVPPAFTPAVKTVSGKPITVINPEKPKAPFKLGKGFKGTDKGSGRGRKFDPNSKQHVAKRLYDAAADKSRENILKIFEKELGLNSGTAMTYYYLARKAV